MRLGITKQTEAVAAHARPLAGRIVAQVVLAKDVVLGAGDVGGRGAGPHGRDAGAKRFTEDAEGKALRVGCLADDQRAANLGEVPLDRRRELRRHQIAGSDAAFRRRRHAEYVRPAGADDHEIVGTPSAPQIGLDVRHHLVLPPPGLYRVAEHGIGVVRHLRRAPQRRDLRRQLVHEQPVEERGRILEREAAAFVREPIRQEAKRRGSEAMVDHPLEPRANGAGDVGCEMDFYSRRLRLGTLGFGGAVEEKLGRAVGRHQRDAVTLEDAEIGGIAQVIALPGVAIEHHVLDAGIRHGCEQMSAPRLRRHVALVRIAPERTGRCRSPWPPARRRGFRAP